MTETFTADGLLEVMGSGRSAPWLTGHSTFAPLGKAEIEAAYRGSGLIRKIIDLPAQDMVRNWRDWQADAAQITALEAEENRLQLRAKVERAEILRGLGGGAMILGLPGDPASPAPDPVRNGLRFIHTVSRWQVRLLDMVDDPLDPLYGGPRMFEMQTSSGLVRIHPSRVVAFTGDPIPEMSAVASADDRYWGDSRVQRIHRDAGNCDRAKDGFASLVYTARLRRIGIPQMLGLVSTDEGQRTLATRLAAMAAGENNWSVTAYDAGDGDMPGETVSDQQVTWSGMPEIMMAFATFLAAAAEMPLTKLLGTAAEGMNSSGSSQQKDWNKIVASRQNAWLRPCLDQIDRHLIPSALGSRPPELWWQFSPLDVPDMAAEAERFDRTMQAVERVQATGTVPDEAMTKAVQSTLVENGWMPGLEQALAEMPDDERFGLQPTAGEVDPSALAAGQ